MSTHEKFNAAVQVVRTLPKKGPLYVDDSTKLKFYSLYKQATEGDNATDKPVFWDIVGRLKWDSWNDKIGLSQEDAKLMYVNLLMDYLKNILESDDAEYLIYQSNVDFVKKIPEETIQLLFSEIKIPTQTECSLRLIKKN